MLIFSFLIVFTGTWVVLCVIGILLLAICVYLPFKYKEMMQIQTTSFLGAWMLVRGISLLVGGYPNEMQVIQWMNEGYVVSTSNYFFVYFIAIALVFLIG